VFSFNWNTFVKMTLPIFLIKLTSTSVSKDIGLNNSWARLWGSPMKRISGRKWPIGISFTTRFWPHLVLILLLEKEREREEWIGIFFHSPSNTWTSGKQLSWYRWKKDGLLRTREREGGRFSVSVFFRIKPK
jgi:hypothetical protein